MRTMISVAILATSLLTSAASAEAINTLGREPVTVHVSTLGVDFSSAEGVRSFHARLKSAAKDACRSDDRTLAAVAADRACARQALDEAVRSVDRPVLTAFHSGAQLVQLAGTH